MKSIVSNDSVTFFGIFISCHCRHQECCFFSLDWNIVSEIKHKSTKNTHKIQKSHQHFDSYLRLSTELIESIFILLSDYLEFPVLVQEKGQIRKPNKRDELLGITLLILLLFTWPFGLIVGDSFRLFVMLEFPRYQVNKVLSHKQPNLLSYL